MRDESHVKALCATLCFAEESKSIYLGLVHE